MAGTTTIGAADRLSTVSRLVDAATTAGTGRAPTRLLDTYTGSASWTTNVPREERHATGTSAEHHRLTGPGVHYDRRIATENGTVVSDR